MNTTTYECSRCDNYTTLWPFTFYNHQKSCKKLQTHFTCEDTIETYICEECNFETHFRTDYDYHLNSQSHFIGKLLEHKSGGCKKFKCNRCQLVTFSKYFFRVHRLTISCWSTTNNNGLLKCKACHATFKRRYNLKMHFRHKHLSSTNSEKRFQCSYCSYFTKNRYNLKQHVINLHTNIDEIEWFKCVQCPYKSKIKLGLQCHIQRLHAENIEQFSCDQCSYKSNIKEYFNNHIRRMHNSSNLYECNQCSFKSKWTYSMKKHITMRHTNPEKIVWFFCEQCNFKTKYKGCLKDHQKRHKLSECEKFQCEKCSFKTDHKRSLKAHIQCKHSDRWYQCADCDFKTGYKPHLSRHYKRKKCHNVNVQIFQV